MSSRLATLVIAALVSTALVAAPAAAANSTSFSDVTGVHVPAVESLAREGIVNGCADGRFCPTSGLTRGQVASILHRALTLADAPDQGFRDTGDSVHRAAIDALAAAGITAGCGSGRFCPTEPITRGQLASLLARALGLSAAPAGTYFADVAGVHAPAIATLAHQGIAAGCSLIHFCTSSQLTRAQGATFVARGLDLVARVSLAPYAERRAQHEAALARAAASSSAGARAVEVARAQVGKPYQWGGNGPSSFDCSGLTRYAWRAAGVDLPRTSADQHRATRRISRSELRPGDLIFYHQPVGHVAMYIGGGRVVESPRSGGSVRISTEGLTRSGIVGYGRPA